MWTNIMRSTPPLRRLQASSFRRSFELGVLERLQLEKYGWGTIRDHAEKIVRDRLMVTSLHDGKQTPFHGHPVFVAQHATATCCRSCLFQWHRIPQHRPMTEEEIRQITGLLLAWIAQQEEKHVAQHASLPAVSPQPSRLPDLRITATPHAVVAH